MGDFAIHVHVSDPIWNLLFCQFCIGRVQVILPYLKQFGILLVLPFLHRLSMGDFGILLFCHFCIGREGVIFPYLTQPEILLALPFFDWNVMGDFDMFDPISNFDWFAILHRTCTGRFEHV